MTDRKPRDDDLKDLAEQAMKEKREETGDESQTRELWDVPTEPDSALVEQQQEEG
jgi:hypothetical protein